MKFINWTVVETPQSHKFYLDGFFQQAGACHPSSVKGVRERVSLKQALNLDIAPALFQAQSNLIQG